MFIIHTRIIVLFILMGWVVPCIAQPEQLTPQKIDAILEKHQGFIDHVQSDAFLEKQMDRAQQLADHYVQPDVIDKLIHPEIVHQKEQRSFNQKLFYDFSIPLDVFSIPVGIYNQDILRVTHLGATWGLEWWFYSSITNTIADIYYQQILTDNHTSYNSQSFKKILLVATLYALASITAHHIKNYYLLNEQIETNTNQPQPISAILPTKFTNTFTNYLTPHSWIISSNDIFKKLELLPEWAESCHWEITKECFATCMWLWWYQKNITRNALSIFEKGTNTDLTSLIKYARQKPNNEQEEKAISKAQQTLHLLINHVTHIPFSQWIMIKTAHMGFWHSMATIVSASPAWISVGKWAYQTYRIITQTEQQKQKGIL